MFTMLGAVGFVQTLIAFLFLLICILLILVILLQKGRGGGLSGAFGGVGGHSAFGAKTGDVFTWVTVALTFFFILLAIIGNYTFVPRTPTVQVPTLSTPGAEPEDGDAGGEPLEGTATQPGR